MSDTTFTRVFGSHNAPSGDVSDGGEYQVLTGNSIVMASAALLFFRHNAELVTESGMSFPALNVNTRFMPFDVSRVSLALKFTFPPAAFLFRDDCAIARYVENRSRPENCAS